MRGFSLAIDFEHGALDSGVDDLRLFADARLDNRQELIATLNPEGGKSVSDTALILAAYLRWGDRCPERLLGDFAFAVWDARTRRLFCARDPLGIKPLHYARVGSLLCLASEVGSILQHPAVPRRLDLVTLGDYLTANTEEPERTFFSDVLRVPPAHRMIATVAGNRLERYWDVDPSAQTVYRDERDYAERFLEVFRQAVSDRLRTESPTVGIAMSGGLDSCSVAAVAHRELDGSRRLLACSFTFDRLTQCDERPYIQAVSQACGIEVAPVDAERFWFLGDEGSYAPDLESPRLSWDSGFRELLRVLKLNEGTVLLTGHGGDDLLRGSSRVYADRLRSGDLGAASEVLRYARSSGRGSRLVYRSLVAPLLPGVDRSLRRLLSKETPPEIPAWIAPDFARRMSLAERLTQTLQQRRGPSARHEIHHHLVVRPDYDRSVAWYDRLSAPFGIEIRHPFLDRRLFELVLETPPRQLFQLGTYKPLLRRAMVGTLPDLVRLRRDKTKLGAFVDYSLCEKEPGKVEQIFAAPLAADLRILDGKQLRAAYRDYRNGGRSDAHRALWYVITLELWLRQHSHLLCNGFGREAGSRKAA